MTHFKEVITLKSLRNIVLIAGLICINALSITANAATEWHLRSPLIFFGVTFGKTNFVAVGEQGAIFRSPDGNAWSSAKSGITETLRAVTFGKDTFIAVGDKGSILTSPDGSAWTTMSSGTSNLLRSIAYGNGTFVAVGDKGTLITSRDGVAWTTEVSGVLDGLREVIFADKRFVITGEHGTILTSRDGAEWKKVDIDFPLTIKSVAHGSAGFVAVGGADNALISAEVPNSRISFLS